jgi:hypothetical protein
MEQNEDLSPAIEDLLAAAPNEASLRRQVTNLLLGGSRDVRLGWLTPTRPIAPIRPEMVAINRLDQAQRSIGRLPIMGRTLPITVQDPDRRSG